VTLGHLGQEQRHGLCVDPGQYEAVHDAVVRAGYSAQPWHQSQCPVWHQFFWQAAQLWIESFNRIDCSARSRTKRHPSQSWTMKAFESMSEHYIN